MGKYDRNTQNVLDILENHFSITETVLVTENLIQYVINSSNHSEIMGSIMSINTNKQFDSEQHKLNYLLVVLKDKRDDKNKGR